MRSPVGHYAKKGALRPPASQREDVVEARDTFMRTMLDLDVTKLVFIDESGFSTSINRAYGWAPVGIKPIIYTPRFGRRVTIVAGIALNGVRAIHVVEGSFDGDRFVDFLANVLGPTLNKGDVVVMDGPRLHRVAGVAEALAAHGATALYLPAYSPELNPIEMCWSVMKAWIRKWAPRARDRLLDAIERAWKGVTDALCRAWIRHSGYAEGST